MSVQLLECLELRVSSTSATEAADRAYAIDVIRKPPFQGHGIDGGTDTDGEAAAKEGICRNRKTRGSRGDGWVGYSWVGYVWGAAVDQLVKK